MELADYERYLIENNLVVPAKCRYYSSWVRKFPEFLKARWICFDMGCGNSLSIPLFY